MAMVWPYDNLTVFSYSNELRKKGFRYISPITSRQTTRFLGVTFWRPDNNHMKRTVNMDRMMEWMWKTCSNQHSYHVHMVISGTKNPYYDSNTLVKLIGTDEVNGHFSCDLVVHADICRDQYCSNTIGFCPTKILWNMSKYIYHHIQYTYGKSYRLYWTQ